MFTVRCLTLQKALHTTTFFQELSYPFNSFGTTPSSCSLLARSSVQAQSLIHSNHFNSTLAIDCVEPPHSPSQASVKTDSGNPISSLFRYQTARNTKQFAARSEASSYRPQISLLSSRVDLFRQDARFNHPHLAPRDSGTRQPS